MAAPLFLKRRMGAIKADDQRVVLILAWSMNNLHSRMDYGR
jgi:hypothetical protein